MNWKDFQAMQKVAEIGEHFVSYVDEGAGEPVILIHGIPTWSYLWHRLIPVLSEQNRVIAPDLIGFGYSDKSDNFDRSIARQTEMIDALMEKMGIEQANIVAHDIGGGVALRLATLYPHRVNKLCVMNSVSYDSWAIEAMIQLGHPSAYYMASASTTVATLRQMLKQGFAETPDDEVLDGIFAPYSTEVGKLSLIRNATALNTNLTTEITHLLHKIEARTLILWGMDDKFQLLKFGKRLSDDIPNAKLIQIKDAGHFVMLDQPEEVADHVFSFLAEK
ncbi:MAG: alpha/beta hydrolase [Acidobacteria bacterium]|jgi:pimeloyl-ACP methyl ester carboxylesterase|nr:alpha/beta hydrolase [Acidobacteriota bacterium]MBA4184503.1 alpha/beta hydrolase [Acidobacteriota bacterium]